MTVISEMIASGMCPAASGRERQSVNGEVRGYLSRPNGGDAEAGLDFVDDLLAERRVTEQAGVDAQAGGGGSFGGGADGDLFVFGGAEGEDAHVLAVLLGGAAGDGDQLHFGGDGAGGFDDLVGRALDDGVGVPLDEGHGALGLVLGFLAAFGGEDGGEEGGGNNQFSGHRGGSLWSCLYRPVRRGTLAAPRPAV
jgi:hypothetical protein